MEVVGFVVVVVGVEVDWVQGWELWSVVGDVVGSGEGSAVVVLVG